MIGIDLFPNIYISMDEITADYTTVDGEAKSGENDYGFASVSTSFPFL